MSYSMIDASRLSRAEAVARTIETEISSGQVSAGQSLGTKDELKRRFGVAVATINEAIKLLGARGLVEARPGPGGGVFVKPANHRQARPIAMDFEWENATMADYHEIRDGLEPIIMRHAAEHHTPEDLERLTAIVDQMAVDLDKPISYLQDNSNFHRALAAISPNKPMRSLYVTVIDFFAAAVDPEGLPESLHKRNVEVHAQVVDALKSGDSKQLKAAMRAHDRHRRVYGLGATESEH